MSRTGKLVARCAAMIAMLAAATGCGGGGGGGGGSATELRVIGFEAAETDGYVYRDAPLVFRFNGRVDPTSVSVAGLQVSQNREVVPGRIEVDRDVIRWFPTVVPGDRNDYHPDNFPPINGLGFAGNGRYTVRMVANSPVSIRSRTGHPLSADFQSSFTTSVNFVPEDPPVPPTVRRDIEPIFDPAPIVDGDPFSTDPNDWPILDPRTVGIEVVMSERMRPATVDPFRTAVVRNVTSISGGPIPAGVGEITLMHAEVSPAGDRIVLRNVVTLGDYPRSDEPYSFEVTLTRGLTDLSGIPLDQEVIFHFRTADRPGEPNHAVLTETFDTQDRLDAEATSARWAGDGVLEGAEVRSRTNDYIPLPASPYNLPQPLVEKNNPVTPRGCRFQMRYDSNHVPAAPGESITGMSWAPRSGYGFPSNYRDVTVKLGHYSGMDLGHMSPEFDANFRPAPTIVFEGTYTVPFATAASWIAWPTFQTDFEYDTTRGLVFEFNMPEGGDTYQLFRNRSNGNFQTYRLYANGNEPRSTIPRENTQYDTRFFFVSKKSVGQSIPIATGIANNDFGGYLVLSDPDRPGTSVTPLWGGSFGGAPPEDFSESINSADQASHIVFRLDLSANAFTGLVPRVYSVSIAYVVPDEEP